VIIVKAIIHWCNYLGQYNAQHPLDDILLDLSERLLSVQSLSCWLNLFKNTWKFEIIGLSPALI
jgi:hypothetical protein